MAAHSRHRIEDGLGATRESLLEIVLFESARFGA